MSALPLTLPFGVLRNGNRLKSFELFSINAGDLNLIQDDTYQKNHPSRWIARTICLCVDSIEGNSVRAEFDREGRKKYPEIVLDLPALDSAFVLYAAHSHLINEKITNVTSVCQMCQRKFTMDIETEDLAREINNDVSIMTSDDTFVVDLMDPYSYPVKDSQILDSNDPIVSLEFRIPTLGDSLKLETEFRDNEIHAEAALLSLVMKSATTTSGNLLKRQEIASVARKIINGVSARDVVAINNAFSRLPHMTPIVSVSCPLCSEDTEVSIRPTVLFPRVTISFSRNRTKE